MATSSVARRRPKAPLTSTSDDSLIGVRLAGRYLVERRLAKGGYADVYAARDQKRGSTVAIKALTAVDTSAIERLKREYTRYGQRFRHQNVAKVLKLGSHAGRLFVVIEYVDGETLADLLRSRRRLEVDEALRIAGQIASGILPGHRAHAVHRDIKPSNIMIRKSDGVVKIIDFGIAKDLLSEGGLTATKEFIGTLGYAPPEQLEGRKVDRRADVFSLGVVLYQLLTGEAPFGGGSTIEIVGKTRNTRPVGPSKLNEQVSEPLAKLIKKMLAKKPDDRPAGMAEVKAEIDRIRASVRDGLDEKETRGVRTWLRAVVRHFV